jgi:hypothetical protein
VLNRSIFLILVYLRFQRLLEHPLLIPAFPIHDPLYLLDHLAKEQWKCAKQCWFELLYILNHPLLRLREALTRVGVTHESEAKPENDGEAYHDLLEDVAEGHVREKSIGVEIVVAIVVTVGEATEKV